MTVDPSAGPPVQHAGVLPIDHPYMVRLIEVTRSLAAKAKAAPLYEQHPIMAAYIDAAGGLDRLTAADTAVWVSWVDALPPDGSGHPVTEGHLMCAANFQTGGSAVRTGYDMRSTAGDPQPTDFLAGMYKTARRKRLRLSDGSILDIPVWRLHRPDRPHSPVCSDTCSDCGTGDYWNLPEFVWPEPSTGLSDPADPSRIERGEKVLWSLGGKPGKVVLTDRALFAHGSTGVPVKRRIGRIIRWNEGSDHDTLIVKWNGRYGGESVLRPHEVQRP